MLPDAGGPPMARTKATVLLLLAALVTQAHAQGPPGTIGADGLTEYQSSLKGPLTDGGAFRLLGPDAKTCVQFEPAGLRLTLPDNHSKERPFTGLASNFGIKGDFELTVAFEVL